MNQLTIRGFDPELLRRLEILAKSEGLSLNQAALKLMRRGAGLEKSGRHYDVKEGIAKYAGVWSQEEFQEFERATAGFEQIDQEMWK
jgi:hypothetical protein